MRKLAAITALTALVLTGCATTEEAPTPAAAPRQQARQPVLDPLAARRQPHPQHRACGRTKLTQVPAAEVYVVECLFGAPGPHLCPTQRSNTDYCANQPGAQEYRDAEAAAAGIHRSSTPTAEPAWRTSAIRADENGNPNPSSGELQFQYACEQGYIDPSECAAAGY